MQVGQQQAASNGAALSSGLDDGLGLVTGGEQTPSSAPTTDGAGVSDSPSSEASTDPTATATTGTGATGTTGPTSAPITAVKSTTPVPVGYLVAKDVGGAFKSLGYDGLSSGSGATQVRSAVKLINSSGGIGGRQIKEVIYEFDATGDVSTTINTACAKFFEDNHVQAVVTIYFHPQLSACAKKHNVPLISDSNASTSESALAQNASLVFPGQPSIEKVASLLPAGLIKAGWISKAKKPVIGLITFETPDYAKVEGIVKSELAKAGLSLKTTTFMPSDSIPQAATAGKAASLKFKAAGVTHVIGVDGGGFGLSWFTLNAGQQGYYPRLGMSSLSAPGAFPSIFSANQLEGAAAIGWAPIIDTVPAQQTAVSARTTSCQNAAKAAGQDQNGALIRMYSTLICDATWFLADTFKGGIVGSGQLQSGIKALTGGYNSAVNFKSNPAKSRTAAAAYKPMVYNAGCDCFKYTGSLQTIS